MTPHVLRDRSLDSVVWRDHPDRAARTWEHVTCQTVDFSRADLGDCTASNCTFIGCNFQRATLRDATFIDCRFYDAEATAACDFRFADARGVRFRGCDLRLANFCRTRLYGIVAVDSDLSGADFSEASFTLNASAAVSLHEASITNCNCAYVSLTRTVLAGADFTGSRLAHAVLDDADLTEAILRDCDLHAANGRNVRLRGADLRGARFNALDPRSIDLDGVRIFPEQAAMLLEPLGVMIVSDC